MIVEQCESENETVAEWYGQNLRSFDRWETFRVSTMRNKAVLVACFAGFYDR